MPKLTLLLAGNAESYTDTAKAGNLVLYILYLIKKVLCKCLDYPKQLYMEYYNLEDKRQIIDKEYQLNGMKNMPCVL